MRTSIVICFAVMLFFCNAEQNTSPKKSYFSSRADRETFYINASRNYYNFRIEGIIVDPAGNSIEDVNVEIKKYNDSMNNAFYYNKTTVRNGSFKFSTSGCYALSLRFKKAGYYAAGTGLVLSALANMLESGEATMEQNTIIRKVKIILYPYGKTNSELLRVDNPILTFSEKGYEKTIIGVVIPYEDTGKRIRSDDEFRFTFTKEKKLPGNLIYIIPGRKKDGSHDGTIHLKTNGINSGFLPVKYDGPHCFRSMWEAPEKGDYQPELVIEDGLTNYLQHNYVKPEAVGNMHPVGAVKLVPKTVPYTVFYFRVNGYYGKGLIMLGNAAGGDSFLKETRASLQVYLYVNRNPGIRNTNVWIGTNW